MSIRRTTKRTHAVARIKLRQSGLLDGPKVCGRPTSTRKFRLAGLVALGLMSLTPLASSAAGLLDIYRLALHEDPEYRGAGAANQAAQESRPQALALLRPNVSASVRITGTEQDVRRSSSGKQRPSFNTDTYTLELSQPLYRQDLWIGLDQAVTQQRQSDVEFAAARQQLMVRVADRYFGVLRTLDELSFAKATLEAFSQQLEQSRQRFEVGLIAITDVEEAKAGYDRANADVIGAVAAVDNSREALREVTGDYHNDLALLGPNLPLVTPEPADIDKWTSTALEQNLSITSARLAIQLAGQEIKRVRSQHLPTLDLIGSHQRQSTGGGINGASRLHTSVIGVALDIPIYQGGLVLSQTRESRHLHRQTLNEFERQRRRAQRTTRDAFLGVQAGISRVAALAQAVQSAQSAKDAIEAGFEVGTRTSVDVLNSDRDLFRARRDHSIARYEYVLNILTLKEAAGILSEDDLSQIDAWLL